MNKPVSAEDIRESIKYGWKEASGWDNCDEAIAELAFLDLMEKKSDAFDKIEAMLEQSGEVTLGKGLYVQNQYTVRKSGVDPTEGLTLVEALRKAVLE